MCEYVIWMPPLESGKPPVLTKLVLLFGAMFFLAISIFIVTLLNDSGPWLTNVTPRIVVKRSTLLCDIGASTRGRVGLLFWLHLLLDSTESPAPRAGTRTAASHVVKEKLKKSTVQEAQKDLFGPLGQM